MAKEIERKFIVTDDSYKRMAVSRSHIVQCYLSRDAEATVRVRIRDDRAYLTVKSVTLGCTRDEWEYEIPVDDARAMTALCRGSIIDKTRWIVEYGSHTWEVDEFESPCRGMVMAEVELSSAGEAVELPPFAGEEVTGNPAYYNSNL